MGDLVSQTMKERNSNISEEDKKNKIHSCDIKPKDGCDYLLINGAEAARFDSLQKAVGARRVMLSENEKESPER